MSYLLGTGILVVFVMKSRYHMKISVEKEMRIVVYNLIWSFEKLKNDQQVIRI